MSKQSELTVFRAVLALLTLRSICKEIGALIERGTFTPANPAVHGYGRSRHPRRKISIRNVGESILPK
jgi:hypothetical protein